LKKIKICFIYSNRAEYSILLPYIEYFKKKSNITEINLSKKIQNIELDKNLSNIYSFCFKNFTKNNYDYVCVLGDRRELSFVAFAALHSGINLVHIAAGEYVQGIPTHDQYVRPIISLLSKYQICFSSKAKKEVKKLFQGISYLKSNTFIFGNPVFSGIEINSLKRIIDENYDLILIHPQSLSREQTKKDLVQINKKLKNKKTIFIEGNKDENYDLINTFFKKLKNNKNYSFFTSLPKKKYFSLVKYCDNFYTNSSSISEIKFLNKNCLQQIGLRNKNRSESIFNQDSPLLLFNLLCCKNP
jgi:UDP-N-acetylglucosamine 2-epimerase